MGQLQSSPRQAAEQGAQGDDGLSCSRAFWSIPTRKTRIRTRESGMGAGSADRWRSRMRFCRDARGPGRAPLLIPQEA